MSKKNKDIEVRVEEKTELVAGNKLEIMELFVGKKAIGKVIPEEKGFSVQFPDGKSNHVKNVDEGFEALIAFWNLND